MAGHGKIVNLSSKSLWVVETDTGPAIGYQNYEAPGVLTQVTQTSSGGLTVEYLGRGAGEPSIGANWNSGVVNMQSDLQTLFINFDDRCPASGKRSSAGTAGTCDD